ncbi:hypothetical protein HK101_012012 [Irineochytrium annulatum]|nr:hypothetical protein HK101_012012 [Irineochytrium annulatum]
MTSKKNQDVSEPLLPVAGSSSAAPDVPPPLYAAIPLPDSSVVAPGLASVDLDDPNSVRAYLTADLSSPKTWLEIRGVMDNYGHTEELFKFHVDITPYVVPTSTTLHGWRSPVPSFTATQTRTPPSARAQLVRDLAAAGPLLPNPRDARALADRLAAPTSSSLHGSWRSTDEAAGVPCPPEEVIDQFARSTTPARGGTTWWRSLSLVRRVAWDFDDVAELLEPLIRAQNPDWGLKEPPAWWMGSHSGDGSGRHFTVTIKPVTRASDAVVGNPHRTSLRDRVVVCALVVFLVSVSIVLTRGLFHLGGKVIAVGAAALVGVCVIRGIEASTMDARARLSCEYEVGLSPREFLRRHALAIVLAAREKRNGVVLMAGEAC